jgi:nucleotide-binding universal stress UspA family protein
MSLKKILVATDLSAPSRLAVDRAATLATERGAELVVLYVFDERDYEQAPPEALAEERNGARLALDAICGALEREGRRASPLLVDGRPDEIITIAAETEGAGLVVVGSLGKTAFERLLVGSVAERVVRSARIPVVVARGPARPFQRILVATDLSEHADRAFDAALEVAPAGAVVDLLHVDEPAVYLSSGPLGVSAHVARLEVEVPPQVAALLARPRREDVAVRFQPVFGRARSVILDRVETGYDLVALGSHGRRGLPRLILGSVAETIVRHAACSVLVVPVSA